MAYYGVIAGNIDQYRHYSQNIIKKIENETGDNLKYVGNYTFKGHSNILSYLSTIYQYARRSRGISCFELVKIGDWENNEDACLVLDMHNVTHKFRAAKYGSEIMYSTPAQKKPVHGFLMGFTSPTTFRVQGRYAHFSDELQGRHLIDTIEEKYEFRQEYLNEPVTNTIQEDEHRQNSTVEDMGRRGNSSIGVRSGGWQEDLISGHNQNGKEPGKS